MVGAALYATLVGEDTPVVQAAIMDGVYLLAHQVLDGPSYRPIASTTQIWTIAILVLFGEAELLLTEVSTAQSVHSYRSFFAY
jgi:hypothetical protein